MTQVIKLDSDSKDEIKHTSLKEAQRGSNGLKLEPPKDEYPESGDKESHDLEAELTIRSDDDDGGDGWDESDVEIEGTLEEVSDENLLGGGELTP